MLSIVDLLVSHAIYITVEDYYRGRLRLGDCKPIDNEGTDGNTTDTSEDNSNKENHNYHTNR